MTVFHVYKLPVFVHVEYDIQTVLINSVTVRLSVTTLNFTYPTALGVVTV
jgi:hypothetical protein